MAAKIKKGDKVVVLAGKDRGAVRPGIDTVRLIGPHGAQWPVRATASSARGE